MKINPSFTMFNISAKGMGIQKKKMELVTENIANTSTTKTSDGTPYKRKYISVMQEKEKLQVLQNKNDLGIELGMRVNDPSHQIPGIYNDNDSLDDGIKITEQEDGSKGDLVFMPDHPDADEDGYVQMPNVSVVTEMVDMIAASRGFEANLTAFNAAKEIAKQSLEI